MIVRIQHYVGPLQTCNHNWEFVVRDLSVTQIEALVAEGVIKDLYDKLEAKEEECEGRGDRGDKKFDGCHGKNTG